MFHDHAVIDSDIRFEIDPYSRTFKDLTPAKKTIVQYDHKSERYTFELPRIIEGHDMILCNVVEVHFTNIDKATKEQNDGYSPITDLHVSSEDETKVVCSWLVSKLSTQNIGPLTFSIRFACVDDSGETTYEWNTKSFSRISVAAGMGNREKIDLLRAQVEEVIEGLGYELPAETFILVDEDGNEAPAVLVEESTVFDATENDIREGKVAATNSGVTTGTKVIPSYHTTEAISIVKPGESFNIPLPSMDLYDYTKLQAIVCPFNESLSTSVAAEKTVINNKVYPVQSNTALSSVNKDADSKSIVLGIYNETDTPYLIRYFTYREVQ